MGRGAKEPFSSQNETCLVNLRVTSTSFLVELSRSKISFNSTWKRKGTYLNLIWSHSALNPKSVRGSLKRAIEISDAERRQENVEENSDLIDTVTSERWDVVCWWGGCPLMRGRIVETKPLPLPIEP